MNGKQEREFATQLADLIIEGRLSIDQIDRSVFVGMFTDLVTEIWCDKINGETNEE